MCLGVGGELARVLKAGGRADMTVFSGVGKTRDEIDQALAANIFALHVESADELATIAAVAQARQVVAPVALRVNPDLNVNTHAYIRTGQA